MAKFPRDDETRDRDVVCRADLEASRQVRERVPTDHANNNGIVSDGVHSIIRAEHEGVSARDIHRGRGRSLIRVRE